jgi:CheY-like chemotaxis protein
MKDLRPILLVEDDDLDAKILKRALGDLNIKNSVIRAENGIDGLEMLKECEKPPYLIFLDLNMPKMNGLEFLKKAKEDPKLKSIPVVVLTTSDSDDDINISFELGASGFMIKSSDFDQFVQTIKKIEEYWKTSKLPYRQGVLVSQS